jgi:hypothetical protein
MGYSTLATPVQGWVVACTRARIRGVEVMECSRERWQVILGRPKLPVLALPSTLGRARCQHGRYALDIMFLVGIGVWILNQGHCGLGNGGQWVIASSLPQRGPTLSLANAGPMTYPRLLHGRRQEAMTCGSLRVAVPAKSSLYQQAASSPVTCFSPTLYTRSPFTFLCNSASQQRLANNIQSQSQTPVWRQ